MSTRTTLNTEWLSTCGGCHVAIVDLHHRILEVLEGVEIQHCPVLTDVKEVPPAVVGIVTGAVRNEHDRHAAERMREACQLVIAFGTCAVYGGLPGAALTHSREEIADTVYRRCPTTRTDEVPSEAISPLEAAVSPLDEVIEVDLYLPGCPPHPAFIFDALRLLLEGREPRPASTSVCGRCTRRMTATDVRAIRANHDGVPDPETCLMCQGYLCMGSVTLDRCLAPCPNNGIVCTGCAGPTMQILTEPNRDIRTEVADRMSRLTAIPAASITLAVERSAKTFYAYAMATRMIGRKPTFLIEKWIAAIEAGR